MQIHWDNFWDTSDLLGTSHRHRDNDRVDWIIRPTTNTLWAEKHNNEWFEQPRMLTCEIMPGPATNRMPWFSITAMSAVFSSNTRIFCLSSDSANERGRGDRVSQSEGRSCVNRPGCDHDSNLIWWWCCQERSSQLMTISTAARVPRCSPWPRWRPTSSTRPCTWPGSSATRRSPWGRPPSPGQTSGSWASACHRPRNWHRPAAVSEWDHCEGGWHTWRGVCWLKL